jgi:hypothetical protein
MLVRVQIYHPMVLHNTILPLFQTLTSRLNILSPLAALAPNSLPDFYLSAQSLTFTPAPRSTPSIFGTRTLLKTP